MSTAPSMANYNRGNGCLRQFPLISLDPSTKQRRLPIFVNYTLPRKNLGSFVHSCNLLVLMPGQEDGQIGHSELQQIAAFCLENQPSVRLVSFKPLTDFFACINSAFTTILVLSSILLNMSFDVR